MRRTWRMVALAVMAVAVLEIGLAQPAQAHGRYRYGGGYGGYRGYSGRGYYGGGYYSSGRSYYSGYGDPYHRYSSPSRIHYGPHGGYHVGPYRNYWGGSSYGPHSGYHYNLHGGYGHYYGL